MYSTRAEGATSPASGEDNDVSDKQRSGLGKGRYRGYGFRVDFYRNQRKMIGIQTSVTVG